MNFLSVSTVLALLCIALAASSADAAGGPTFVAEYVSANGAFGTCIDRSTNTVYVTSLLGNVKKMSAGGSFTEIITGLPGVRQCAIHSGVLYVLTSSSLHKYDLDGGLLISNFIADFTDGSGVAVSSTHTVWIAAGSSLYKYVGGTRSQTISAPGILAVAVDASDNVYYSGNGGTVEKFSPDGTSVGTFIAGLGGDNAGGIAVDAAGNVYVSLYATTRVAQYNSAGGSVDVNFATGLNQNQQCATGTNIFVVISQAGSVYVYSISGGAQASGDPQIDGFLGQSMQVHGEPNTYYNMLSGSSIQENALFKFISQGGCPSKQAPKTLCWTHPGTYLSEIGFNFNLKYYPSENGAAQLAKANLTLLAGSGDEGMRVVLNGEPIKPSGASASWHIKAHKDGEVRALSVAHHAESHRSKEVVMSGGVTAPLSAIDGVDEFRDNSTQRIAEIQAQQPGDATARARSRASHSHVEVDFITPFELIVHTNDFRFRIVNSDGFFNQQVSLLHKELYLEPRLSLDETDGEDQVKSSAAKQLHGILGQSVVFRRYNNRWRYLQGDIDQYKVSNLLATDDEFSLFKH